MFLFMMNYDLEEIVESWSLEVWPPRWPTWLAACPYLASYPRSTPGDLACSGNETFLSKTCSQRCFAKRRGSRNWKEANKDFRCWALLLRQIPLMQRGNCLAFSNKKVSHFFSKWSLKVQITGHDWGLTLSANHYEVKPCNPCFFVALIRLNKVFDKLTFGSNWRQVFLWHKCGWRLLKYKSALTKAELYAVQPINLSWLNAKLVHIVRIWVRLTHFCCQGTTGYALSFFLDQGEENRIFNKQGALNVRLQICCHKCSTLTFGQHRITTGMNTGGKSGGKAWKKWRESVSRAHKKACHAVKNSLQTLRKSRQNPLARARHVCALTQELVRVWLPVRRPRTLPLIMSISEQGASWMITSKEMWKNGFSISETRNFTLLASCVQIAANGFLCGDILTFICLYLLVK